MQGLIPTRGVGGAGSDPLPSIEAASEARANTTARASPVLDTMGNVVKQRSCVVLATVRSVAAAKNYKMQLHIHDGRLYPFPLQQLAYNRFLDKHTVEAEDRVMPWTKKRRW